MIGKLLKGAAIAAVTFALASVANAGSLTVVGGADHSLSGFDLSGTTGLNNGDGVKLFDGDNDLVWLFPPIFADDGVPDTDGLNGLQLSGAPSTLRFTYLGSEAGDLNRAFYSGTSPATLLFDTSSGIGTFTDILIGTDGAVPFYFENEGGYSCAIIFCWENDDEQANNEDGIDWHVSLAFYQESATSVIALFGDGSGDLDMDDMAMRISVVPLPPALLMFGAALIGLGWFRRRKMSGTA
ncbi:VPLPA-CTERM sorting domain-containing protein [Sneathiella glossodoripedis]|uniref:VPLPA-CTERM sorting domain-containing protein n=1 Tax=Sneathiella glossodoripedis TaxID=418853 RepID=UPI0011DD2305|nr:VPLPA-CTERM sorting domain-containing protein [Sneathiella glossodoripedis]